MADEEASNGKRKHIFLSVANLKLVNKATVSDDHGTKIYALLLETMVNEERWNEVDEEYEPRDVKQRLEKIEVLKDCKFTHWSICGKEPTEDDWNKDYRYKKSNATQIFNQRKSTLNETRKDGRQNDNDDVGNTDMDTCSLSSTGHQNSTSAANQNDIAGQVPESTEQGTTLILPPPTDLAQQHHDSSHHDHDVGTNVATPRSAGRAMTNLNATQTRVVNRNEKNLQSPLCNLTMLGKGCFHDRTWSRDERYTGGWMNLRICMKHWDKMKL